MCKHGESFIEHSSISPTDYKTQFIHSYSVSRIGMQSYV